MLNKEVFFQESEECDPSYMNIRDCEGSSEAKDFIEGLWRDYRPYADTHFLSEAITRFQARFWEMYLGVTLMKHGFEIDSDKAVGPEFFIKGTPKIWIEAITPELGHGPDSVPELEYGRSVATKSPSEEIILRLRHAIEEKHRKYIEYFEKGIVGNGAKVAL